MDTHEDDRPTTVMELSAGLKGAGLNGKYRRLKWILSKLPGGAFIKLDRPGVLSVETKTGVPCGRILVRAQSYEPIVQEEA